MNLPEKIEGCFLCENRMISLFHDAFLNNLIEIILELSWIYCTLMKRRISSSVTGSSSLSEKSVAKPQDPPG